MPSCTRRQPSLSLRPLNAAARHQHRLHPGPRIAVSEAQHAGQRGERGARGGGPALWREVDLNCRGRSRAVGVRGGPAAHAPPADTIVGACDDERATGAVRGALHQAQAPEGARLRVVGVGVQAAERERAVTGRTARPQRGREAEAGPVRVMVRVRVRARRTTWLRPRPAGAPEAPLSAKARHRLPRAPASLGRFAAWAAPCGQPPASLCSKGTAWPV